LRPGCWQVWRQWWSACAIADRQEEPSRSPRRYSPPQAETGFGIEIEGCVRCGGQLRIIASIEEPAVIAKILAHLVRTAPEQYPTELPLGARAGR